MSADNQIGSLRVDEFDNSPGLNRGLQFTLADAQGNGKYIQLDRVQLVNLLKLILKWLLTQ